jgi:4-hydroxy-tetrahydrodipicolinate reductase
MRVLLIGYGRMGRLVAQLAPECGCDVVQIVTSRSGPDAIGRAASAGVDVAIDFSTAAAVVRNLPELAAHRIDAVVGTTGWRDQEEALRRTVEQAGVGVLAASNFSVGMSIFRRVVEEAAARFAAREDAGAFIHEAHHAAKKDAPSGTALTLRDAMIAAGYARPIDVSSTRAGAFPGTHVVGFDSAAETVTLTHVVRDRSVFARGALEAAKWLRGRKGWFTMEEMTSGVTPEVVLSTEEPRE